MDSLGWWPCLMRVLFNASLVYVLWFKKPPGEARDIAVVACLGCIVAIEHVRALAKRIPDARAAVADARSGEQDG